MTFPVSEQVTEQVKKLVLMLGSETKSTNDLMQNLDLKHRQTFLYDYLRPALKTRACRNDNTR